MNRGNLVLAALSGAALLGGCAGDYPYSAPVGSTLSVSPTTIAISGTGTVLLLEAQVLDSEGSQLSQILVTVQASGGSDEYSDGPNFILVPETAILSQNNNDDTTWQVDAAEQYYELTRVDDQIQPDFAQIETDSHGIARVYLYIRCVATDCAGYSDCHLIDLLENDPDYVISLFSGEECKGLGGSVYFYIGPDSQEVKVTLSNYIISIPSLDEEG